MQIPLNKKVKSSEKIFSDKISPPKSFKILSFTCFWIDKSLVL